MKRWLIPLIGLILTSLSLLSIRSIAIDLVGRQLLFFVFGWLIFWWLSRSQFDHWQSISLASYVLLNVVLLTLLIFGRATRGTVGWINLFAGFKIQPSQFAIVITGMFLAFLAKRLNTHHWKDMLIWLGLILLPAVLIGLEPDLGTTLVFLVSLGSSLLIIKTPKNFWIVMVLFGILTSFVLWNFVLQPYQKQRITTFVDGHQQSDASYNARQALIAVGSGQMYGRGLGFGVQSHLKFLPERQTDFVFASIAEEWGFIGSALIIFSFGGLLFFLAVINQADLDKTYRLFLQIITAMLLIKVTINIGMNLGLLPITGITLPLLSYGGSSIVATLVSLGLVQSIIIQQKSHSRLDIE